MDPELTVSEPWTHDPPALLVDGPELRDVVLLEAHGQRDPELPSLHPEFAVSRTDSETDPITHSLILHTALIVSCNLQSTSANDDNLALWVESCMHCMSESIVSFVIRYGAKGSQVGERLSRNLVRCYPI